MSDDLTETEWQELGRLRRENERLQSELASYADDFAKYSQPPAEIARHYEHDAAADPDQRAQNLNEAAAYWVMAGDLERARRLYLDAIADGGRIAGGRIWYALFLLEHGDEQAGRELLETIFAEGPEEYLVYEAAGEAFEGREEYEQALRWFEAGMARLRVIGDNSAEGLGRYRLALGRSRVRESLGLAADDVDREAQREQQAWVARIGRWWPERTALSVLYLPEEEYERALQLWPALGESHGTHAEHRERVEHTLRELEVGRSPRIAFATAAGLVEFGKSEGLDPALPDTRTQYAAELSAHGHDLPWPPGRNDPCWCGSGRKYKKCCGRPG